MAKHVKLFENWLEDIANKAASLFTGSAVSTRNKSDAEFKEDFADTIVDISDQSEQPRMDPMKQDKYFVVHHTAGRGTAEGVVDVLNKRGLGVQWVIDREGKIYRTLPEGIIGWHAGHRDQKDAPSDLQNHNSQGVEVIANNDADVLPIQVVAAFKLLKWLGYDKEDVWGHGEVTYNKESTEGKTIVDYWRKNFDKTPEEAEEDILGSSEA